MEEVLKANRSPERRWVFLLLGGALLGVIVAMVAWRWHANTRSPEAATGRLLVGSQPSGAVVFINGRSTEQRTPAEIDGLPRGEDLSVKVLLPSPSAQPQERTVVIAEELGQASIDFRWATNRSIEIVTVPSGASVVVNGIKTGRITPTRVDDLALDQTTTVAASMDGFVPMIWRVPPPPSPSTSTATTTVLRATLDTATEIDVHSDPPGAEVQVDGSFRGDTPLYGILVPKARPFALRIEHTGFKPWQRKLRSAAILDRALLVKLKELPLISMPLNAGERHAVEALETSHEKLSLERERLKMDLAAVETAIQKVADPEAEGSATDDPRVISATGLRSKIAEIERQLDEISQEENLLRRKVLERATSRGP